VARITGVAGVAQFAVELRRAAAAIGLTPRLVAEEPAEWRLGRVTVVVDRVRGAAQVRFARVAVAKVAWDAGLVVAACSRVLARLQAESLSPEQFAGALVAAYPGGAVPLVELVPRVARAAGRRRYTRAQFVWDLARLRSERGLVLPQGHRIAVDVATGAGAPARALWIEDESGTGQYYRTLRLLETA
jgi:hypothetical protein